VLTSLSSAFWASTQAERACARLYAGVEMLDGRALLRWSRVRAPPAPPRNDIAGRRSQRGNGPPSPDPGYPPPPPPPSPPVL